MLCRQDSEVGVRAGERKTLFIIASCPLPTCLDDRRVEQFLPDAEVRGDEAGHCKLYKAYLPADVDLVALMRLVPDQRIDRAVGRRYWHLPIVSSSSRIYLA